MSNEKCLLSNFQSWFYWRTQCCGRRDRNFICWISPQNKPSLGSALNSNLWRSPVIDPCVMLLFMIILRKAESHNIHITHVRTESEGDRAGLCVGSTSICVPSWHHGSGEDSDQSVFRINAAQFSDYLLQISHFAKWSVTAGKSPLLSKHH